MNRPIKSFSSFGSPHHVGLRDVLLLLIILIALAPVLTAAQSPSEQSSTDVRNPLAQRQDTPRVLDQGKPVVRELAGSETHSYQILLTAGQFLKVAVDQRGINVLLVIYGPNEKIIAEVDGPFGSQGEGNQNQQSVADDCLAYLKATQ